MLDMSEVIKAKSNQLNAVDLTGRKMVITIRKVDVHEGKAIIHFHGDNGRPYNASKNMSRLMAHAWGINGNDWIGKSLEIYCDPTVRFGKFETGGIRISAMSHVDQDFNKTLPVSAGKYQTYFVKHLPISTEPVTPQFYPDEKFDAEWPKIESSVLEKGEKQKQVLIDHLTKLAPLTKRQFDLITNIQLPVADNSDTTEETEIF